MTLTHNYYENLRDSLKKGNHSYLSRIYTTSYGLSLIYAMMRDNERRALYFPSDEKAIDNMPQCKGLSIRKVHLYEYSPVDYYCEIAQSPGSEGYIFEIIIEDIRKNVDELMSEQKIAASTASRLLKWKSFFAQERNVLLSSERQQGLYGELLFLKELIGIYGSAAVSFWTGSDYETHDFYMRGNAVEVKTTSTKAPYKMHISSEYQLDDSEVSGSLLINFYALRKSSADGETLPEIVRSIRNIVNDNPSMSKKFDSDLEAYGYYDGLEDKYQTDYHVREEHTYRISNGFPRIVKSSLAAGITGCTYDVSINDCTLYEISFTDKESILKGSEIIGR
jgi:hypothetical protein